VLVRDSIEQGIQTCQQPSHVLPLFFPLDGFRARGRALSERRRDIKANNAADTVSSGPNG
jgi:hypothetical protein